MSSLVALIYYDMKRRTKDGFILGYNIIFPVVLIFLLGYLLSGSYGKEFTSYHYYTIVMLPFCVSMAMITAAYAGKDEAYKKTASRLLFAPISKSRIVISKLISCTILISFCNILVLLISKLVFQLPSLLKLIPVVVLLTAETFCICAIGLFIGLGMKNFILIKNVMNLPVMAAAILGGAFYPISSCHKGLNFVIYLSPLTWINKSIFLFLYDNKANILWNTVVILSLIGVSFTALTVLSFRKEEFIHGDLSGYEK